MTMTVDNSYVALVRLRGFGDRERHALAAHAILETFGGTRPQPDTDEVVELSLTLVAPSKGAACVRIMQALDGLAPIWPSVANPLLPDDGSPSIRVCWHMPGALEQCRAEACT